MPGTWKPLANQPTFGASTMLLLTDGTVMCQEVAGKNWSKLTPDHTGDYANGTWTALTPMKNTRLYYASAVLADGRVFVAGGEDSDAGSETNKGEIFTPPTDPGAAVQGVWHDLVPPAGWSEIGDAPCCVLPDGRVLLGQINDPRTTIFDPHTDKFVPGPSKDDASAEESWVLLSDDTVLTVECRNHPKAEKYVVEDELWVGAGSTPVELVEAASIEIGPGLRLPNGHAFFVGATGNTALYHPPEHPSHPGTWKAGPKFPMINGQTIGAKDAPGCLLPNGKVLCLGGPVDGISGNYNPPTYCFEFNGHTMTQIPSPPSLVPSTLPYNCRMLLLPTGQVLLANGDVNMQVYSPDGHPEEEWRPRIEHVPHHLRPGHRSTLFGHQLNGLSQACAYGDDVSSATNYPLVFIRNRASGQVVYCTTNDHGTMGVATGHRMVSTHFTLPKHIERGPSDLHVVANGIASEGVHVHVLHH